MNYASGVLLHLTGLRSHHTAFLPIRTSSTLLLLLRVAGRPLENQKAVFCFFFFPALILNMHQAEPETEGVWQILIIADDHNAWNLFFAAVGSNKAWSRSGLMGAGSHSFFLWGGGVGWGGLIEVYLKVSLVNCWTGSCSLSRHTPVRACERARVTEKTSGCTRGLLLLK